MRFSVYKESHSMISIHYRFLHSVANSSVVTYNQRTMSSLKSFLRRRLFKKIFALIPSRQPIYRPLRNHSQTSGRFQRIKGTNKVGQVNLKSDCNWKTYSINNYDMTIFHDDTRMGLSLGQSMQIPLWATQSQLELAVINQIYFSDKNPDDIFGSIHMDLVHEVIESIEFYNDELPSLDSSSMFSDFDELSFLLKK